MSTLRNELRQGRARHRRGRYPGDLADELLRPRRFPGLMLFLGTALAAGVALAVWLQRPAGPVTLGPAAQGKGPGTVATTGATSAWVDSGTAASPSRLSPAGADPAAGGMPPLAGRAPRPVPSAAGGVRDGGVRVARGAALGAFTDDDPLTHLLLALPNLPRLPSLGELPGLNKVGEWSLPSLELHLLPSWRSLFQWFQSSPPDPSPGNSAPKASWPGRLPTALA